MTAQLKLSPTNDEPAGDGSARAPGPAESGPRVVYTLPPVSMGVVTHRDGRQATVTVGGQSRELTIDRTVDAALVDEAIDDGRRVILDPASNTLCGVLQIARSLTIDSTGAVTAEVQRLDLTVREYARLKSRESFLQIDDDRVEVYARETLLRARDTFRALARLIKLN